MLQTRKSLCRLFRFWIQYIYTPDTTVILIFIQESNIVTARIRSRNGRPSFAHTNPNTVTTQIRFKYGYQSGDHSPDFQQTILDGIFKPISSKILPSPNGIFKPIPYIINHYITKCKFLGTLVFNHLPPSSHEWRTHQSNSSGLRRLNRGSCCTPKTFPLFLKTFLTKDLQCSRILKKWSYKITSETLRPQIRVLIKNEWSLTFDLIYDLMVWSIISKSQI